MNRNLFLLLILLPFFISIGCSERGEATSDIAIAEDVGLFDVITDTMPQDVIERVESCKPAELKDINGGLYGKFSLSLFHYNIQYIAGGGEKYENAIIRIGFEPILDILLRHPDWKFTIEMQGYMIEIMAGRFPKTFEKLKSLVKNCQVELISFHYSDQLFLAYPEMDMQWSFDLNRAVFERFGLFPSGVVFTQEGQFGEGMLKFMRKNGLSIGLYPKNLFRYFNGGMMVKPLYSKYETDVVIVGAGVNSDGVVVDWSYFNDGELLTTGGFSPYFVDTGNYKIDEESIRKYEDELLQKEKDGYKITSIGDYVSTIKAKGIKPEPLPPLLDGTWQPDDTNNLHRWMGDAKGPVDRDNKVLSSNYSARKYVQSLEKMIKYADGNGVDTKEYETKLLKAKRFLAYAEVSDSTGWYPNLVEVNYSLENAKSARELSIDAIKSLSEKLKFKKVIRIDNYKDEISETEQIEDTTIDESCPDDILLDINSDYYSYEIFCKKINDFRTDVRVLFSPRDKNATRSVQLTLNFDTDEIEYVPALMDSEGVDSAILSYKGVDFARKELNTSLATGLIKVADRRYLIKHCEYFHIAPFINFENRSITFIDNSPESEGFEWRFSIVNGDKSTAFEEMKRINTLPVVYIDMSR
ncbi:MAG: hypothetical protein ACP5QK_11195 [Myxococcota bacterium]